MKNETIEKTVVPLLISEHLLKIEAVPGQPILEDIRNKKTAKTLI